PTHTIQSIQLKRSEVTFDEASKVGSGSVGTVYSGLLLREGSTAQVRVAVKRLFLISNEDGRAEFITSVKRYAAMSANLTNSNVLPLIGIYAESRLSMEVLLVSPFAEQGNLRDYLKRESPTYARRLEIRNVLVKADGCVVLTDYDFKVMLTATETSFVVRDGPGGDAIRDQSPETRLQVVPKIICNELPYKDSDTSEDIRASLERNEVPAPVDTLQCPDRAKNLLSACWDYNPDSRLSINEILSILGGQAFKFKEMAVVDTIGLRCLKLSRDAKLLALGFNNRIGIYRANTGELSQEISLPMEVSDMPVMQFSPSSKFLIASTINGVMLLDLDKKEFRETFTGHSGTVWAVDVSRDDTFAVTGSSDCSLRTWYISDPGQNQVFSMGGSVCGVEISPLLDVIAVGVEDKGVILLDIQTGGVLAMLGPARAAWCLHFSEDRSWLFAGNNDRELWRWNLGAREIDEHTRELAQGRAWHKHTTTLTTLSGSQNGRWAVSLANNGDVLIADGDSADTGVIIGRVPPDLRT
ncbi:Dip2/Utp12 protein, partial [Tulasnella sp. 403]